MPDADMSASSFIFGFGSKVSVTAAAMRDFRELGQAQLKLAVDATPVLNEYVMLASNAWTEPARHVGEGAFVPLALYREFLSADSGARKGLQMPRGMRVIPKNFEQWIFLDALLNPDIKLVTCFGRAGTGKTFLSIAAALSQVLSDFSPYKKLSAEGGGTKKAFISKKPFFRRVASFPFLLQLQDSFPK